MAEDKGKVDVKGDEGDVKGDVAGDVKPDEFYLGSWKDKAAAEKGLANMQKELDSKGNEVGDLRTQGASLQKQVDFTQEIIEDMKSQSLAKPKAAETPVGDSKAEIKKARLALDPVDENYQAQMIAYSDKLEAIARQETLDAATEVYKNDLDDRDTKATHNAFYKENPDFNTPEMQMRIKEYIAKDTTGMSDPLVAYREIQRDDIAAEKTRLTEENAELKRIMELAKGADETGKVIIKGQTPSLTKPPKATGQELTKGMQAALDTERAKG